MKVVENWEALGDLACVLTHPVFAQPLNLPSLLLRRKEGLEFISALAFLLSF
jgi:hypothetical protein